MRTGKIARLPRDIRAQLNRRLANGESARRLASWLNSLPEVQSILRCDFDARPINEPNLTEWKQGGYLEWLAQQEALGEVGELASNAAELTEAACGCTADHLATVLAARYAAHLSALNGEPNDQLRQRLRALREFCHDVIELRRGDHNAARLKIEQARLDEGLEKNREAIFEYFMRWIEYPKVRDCIRADHDTPRAQRARLRELLGLEPESPLEHPIPTEN